VVGHVEWVQFARVGEIPRAGQIVNAQGDFEEPAGGGAVAAVQLARIAGEALLITALGQDEQGRKSQARLEELGVRVCAAPRRAPTRRALTLLDARGERVITTFGERLQPSICDQQLPWGQLAQMDGVYFTAGDAGALQAARAARTLVCTPRAGDVLGGGVQLDALVLSAGDALECRQAAQLSGAAHLVV
jgi:ribokinase